MGGRLTFKPLEKRGKKKKNNGKRQKNTREGGGLLERTIRPRQKKKNRLGPGSKKNKRDEYGRSQEDTLKSPLKKKGIANERESNNGMRGGVQNESGGEG